MGNFLYQTSITLLLEKTPLKICRFGKNDLFLHDMPYFSCFFSVKDQIEREGIHCIIGYYDKLVAIAAEKSETPFLTTTLWSGATGKFTFHMLPRAGEITQPIVEVMQAYNWRTVAVIYEETLGVVHLLTL